MDNKNDSKNKENITKIKNKKCIYFLGWCFFTSYLIGLFQLLNLFDACKTEMGIVFKSSFYNKNKDNEATFKELYINSSIKMIPEFDFVFFTSFIGSLPLQLLGFLITSLFFTLLNIFLFINFMDLNFNKEKYELKDFSSILIYFISFFISFGAISLISHEILFEGILEIAKTNKKFKEKEKEKEKEKNLKF